jgi:hypothetical protein
MSTSAKSASGRDQKILALSFAAVCLIEIAFILRLNDGRFFYTLDDPYLHLALAENILRGHYGVNLAEPSAASSSILWPFLLAPFLALPHGELAPLLINFLLGVAILLVMRSLVAVAFPAHSGGLPRRFPLVGTLLLIPATNLVGLTLNGMEHSLQLLCCLALLAGILRGREKPLPVLFYVAIVVGPLVRYELLALSAGSVVFLLWRRERRAAFFCVAATFLLVGSFSLYLRSLGLAHLPTSVLAKTPHFSPAARPVDFVLNVKRNLTDRQGALMGIAWVLLCFAAASSRRSAHERAVAAWTAFALGAHLLLGRFGWYNRYEIYIWATVLLAMAHLFSDAIRGAVAPGSAFRRATLAAAFLVLGCFPYTTALVTAPIASNNVYQQHGQMHRFATEFFPGAAAANDIGVLSFRNDAHVLDLWGVASTVALDLRRFQDVAGWVDPAWIGEEARKHDVRFAMLYSALFPNLPDDFIPLGEMHLGRGRVSATRSVVTFYAVGEEKVGSLERALEEFVPTLPRGVRFERRRE